MKLERAQGTPKVAEIVYDSKLRPVGRVHDILGSVESPYVLVKPNSNDSSELVGRLVYADVSA